MSSLVEIQVSSETLRMSAETGKSRPSVLERKQSTIDQTISSPGAVTINVQGAFIVDEDPSRPSTPSEDGAQHDTEIRLPNHRSVVSHIALDASFSHTSEGISDTADMRMPTLADWRLVGKVGLLLPRA